MTHGATGSGHGYQSGQVPNALRIGLLGPLQVRDETGRPVRVGGRQLRVLLTLLALNAGRVVPAGSLAGHIWPDDPPGNPGNALQTLVSRRRRMPSAVERGRGAEPLDQAGGLYRVRRCRVISHEPIVGHAAVRTRTAACQALGRLSAAQ